MEVRKSTLKLALGAGCALAVLAAASAANAEQRTFSLASSRATDTIPEFARQAGIQIVAPADRLRNVNTRAIEGRYDTREALAMLVEGTGLRIASDDGRTVTLVAADPQSGSAAGGGAEVEALIVTAQKREEDIQDVPIAISAFSQEDLTRSQIAGGPDLITQVPNMTFTKTNFSSYSIQLRGIGTQAISATTDPAVAVAFNNTPFIRNRFFEQEFYDLQRVEVLRGPQGTLYGRNATAGVVNIISQKPKFVAEAKLSGDLGNYKSSRIEGMVNIPLVEDKVALRLAGAWTKREGYATNQLDGEQIDGRDLWSTRLSLRFSPTDRIDANLIWEHFEENDDRLRSGKQLCDKHVRTDIFGEGTAPGGSTVGADVTNIPLMAPLADVGQSATWATVNAILSQGCERNSLYSPDSFQTPMGTMLPYYVPLSGIGLPIARTDPYASTTQSQDLRVIESSVDPEYKAKSDLAEFQINIDLSDTLTLTSETAYASDFVWSLQDFNRFNTARGAWLNPGDYGTAEIREGVLQTGEFGGYFCDPQLGCSDRMIAVDLSTAKARQFSQEFRIGSDFDGPFNFSIGANFLRADSEDKYYVFFNSLSLSSADKAYYTPPYVPGVSDNSECLEQGFNLSDPDAGYGFQCVYIDPNPIGSLNDQGHNYFLSKNPYKLISYAVFGETYYNITDALKVTAGLRWTVDKKEAPRIPTWVLVGSTWGYPVKESIRQEWREPTGRLTLDWKPDLAFTDETLLYASYAHGYKAGGANPPPYVFVGPNPEAYGSVAASELRPRVFEAEFVDAYELGAKNTLLDGAVTLNLAAFYYDYKDYQISEIVDRSAFNRNFDATVWGLEFEADWRPLENLKFGFKGGYEKTRIADGERAIDLMDRTAGDPNWIVVRPFPTFASSCILPTWLYAHEGPVNGPGVYPNLYGLGAVGGGGAGGCELAYLAGLDPVTAAPYTTGEQVPGPFQSTLGFWFPGTYPGWNPKDASQGHNNGEGIFKDLSGNELPNAPQYTATITADYTLPLPNDWLATLHTDLHWQSESWWRVFNDHEYNRLDEYFTMNLAAIFTNEDAGWNIMAYIKNVTDETAITGAFLNSDDTGLTTNVFLTEPRLYGLRVTKLWSGGAWFDGFSRRSEGPFPLTVEIGGQIARFDAPYQRFVPNFIDEFSPHLQQSLNGQGVDMDWGDAREVKLTWRPNAGPWSVSGGVRFGKTNTGTSRLGFTEEGDSGCKFRRTGPKYYRCDPEYSYADGRRPYHYTTDWSDGSAHQREEYQLIDFEVGKDVGLGSVGTRKSKMSAGLRYAQFKSNTNATFNGVPNWDVPDGWGEKYMPQYQKYGPAPLTHDKFEAAMTARRSFEGAGPILSWDASAALLGNDEVGHLDLDWSVGGGALFGTRTADETGSEYTAHWVGTFNHGSGTMPAIRQVPYTEQVIAPLAFSRSEDVTVPMLDLSLGLSYEIDRIKIGAGYRWERYFDVLDVGIAEKQDADRTIDGPYFKIAVGFGG